MKKSFVPWVVVCLLVLLPATQTASGMRAGSQEYVEIPIKITPDVDKVIAAFEGGEPLTFTVETDPKVSVSIMVATSFDLLLTEKGQAIGKVFISHYGKQSAGIPPAVLKADEQGRLTYTLPTRVFEAMSEGHSRIYYVAEVINARGEEHYDVLGVSFDYQSGREEDAPYVTVEESPRIAESKTRFEAGQAHFMKKEYAAAAKEFNEALILYPNPDFEYDIGMCHLRLGLQYISTALESGRYSTEEEAKMRELIAAVEKAIQIRW